MLLPPVLVCACMACLQAMTVRYIIQLHTWQALTHAWAGQEAQARVPEATSTLLDRQDPKDTEPAAQDTHVPQSPAVPSDRADPQHGSCEAPASDDSAGLPSGVAGAKRPQREPAEHHQLLELVIGDQRRAVARFAPPLPGAYSSLRFADASGATAAATMLLPPLLLLLLLSWQLKTGAQ